MSLEEQFNREENMYADDSFRELTSAERSEILAACKVLMEHPEHELVLAQKRVLGLLHKVAAEELFVPRVGQQPEIAHAIDEACRARCAALIDAIELPTDEEGLMAIVNNLHKE